MQLTAERVPVMTASQTSAGRQAIVEVVTGIQLAKIAERLNKKKIA